MPPQVAIVGAGTIRPRIVAHNGAPAVRRTLPLSLTFDHRVATGAEAARFLKAMIELARRKVRMIRKLKDGRYRLYSRKLNPRTGKRRNLGTFNSKAAALKHERAVQFFKRGGRAA